MSHTAPHPALPALVLMLLVLPLLGACGSDDPDRPYVEFAGGGFVFNYRLAEADYGFVVKPLRRIPAGTVLEASFEDPAGGPPLPVTQVARDGMLQYAFRSPSVTGVVAGRPYRVTLTLRDPDSGNALARYQRDLSSEVDQAVLPDRPLVVGPGHHPAPEKTR